MNSRPAPHQPPANTIRTGLQFTPEQLTALFAAIEANDRIDLSAELPAPTSLRLDRDTLQRSLCLCRQFWYDGTDRAQLAAIVKTLRTTGSLEPATQVTFKYIRARFKHLRFGCALYGSRHRYPALLHLTTSEMGRLQDAFKNGRLKQARNSAKRLRLMLARVPYRYLQHEIDAVVPCTPDSFSHYLQTQMGTLTTMVERGYASAMQFHVLRKIISRQSALCCNLQVIAPSPTHTALGRYLATLNGMMGSLHDDAIEQRFDHPRDYKSSQIPIPAQLATRLVAVARWYGAM